VASAAAPVSRTKTAPALASRNCSTPVKLWAAPGQLDRASECQAAGLERLRQAPHLSLAQHDNEPLAMFQRSSPLFMSTKMALEIWKCWFPWPLGIFSAAVGNDFQQPHGNQECAISNVQHVHPLRGTACAEHRRPVLGRRGVSWLRQERRLTGIELHVEGGEKCCCPGIIAHGATRSTSVR
jgi:hypothetical protein